MRRISLQPRADALSMSEAAPLLAGWLSWLLARQGTRFLLIKGVSLTRHGLRPARVSSDVDVLIAPPDIGGAVTALREAGWQLRPVTYAQQRYSEHSVSLFHELWPIDIDVHRFFPGFLEDATHTFDVLWSRREEIQIAGIQSPIPDRHSSALILALHSYRGLSAETRHRRESTALGVGLKLSQDDACDMLALAVETGSDATLRDFLGALGVAVPPSGSTADPALQEWNDRVHSPSRSAHMWWRLIHSARGAEKLRAVRYAVWPKAEDLDILYFQGRAASTTWGYSRLRLKRLARGGPVLWGVVRLWWGRLWRMAKMTYAVRRDAQSRRQGRKRPPCPR